MFGRSWRIGTIRGIPVSVDSSWVWIAVLITYTLWAQFDALYAGVGTGTALALAVFAAALFFASVFLHELAHAVAARLHHIPVFGITLVFFGGFTSAKSDAKGPGPAFVISAVGPGTSAVLGVLFWRLSLLFAATNRPLAAAFGYLGWVNGFMAAFNVIPGLPLDGGRMLEAVVWRVTGNRDRSTQIAAYAGMGVGVLLAAIGLGLAAGLYDIANFHEFGGLWFAIIGVFIFQGARGSERQIALRRTLAGATVADAMDPPPPSVPADMALSEVLERYLRGHEGEAFPVVEGANRVIGMISMGSARPIGQHDPLRPARDALIPLSQVVVTQMDEPLDEAAAGLGTRRAALVLRDGQLVGAITGEAVARWAARAHPV
ncbi:MAG TPA: site-2 protease family protein [Actinomycetota bacterium]